MSLQYTAADETDIPVIFAQAKDLIDRYEDTAAIDYEQVLSWYRRKLTANISQYRCVLLGGRKAAYYRLCEDGELDDLYVLPEFRGCGIGTQILEKCISESEKDIYLYVFSRNARAVSFYRRFGFTVRETVGQTRCIMSRSG